MKRTRNMAERVLHSSLLGVLLDDAACRNAAALMLERLSDQYLRYPNVDNVLGPSRPFFSTYLESIWLLQLSLALDFLETEIPRRRRCPLARACVITSSRRASRSSPRMTRGCPIARCGTTPP